MIEDLTRRRFFEFITSGIDFLVKIVDLQKRFFFLHFINNSSGDKSPAGNLCTITDSVFWNRHRRDTSFLRTIQQPTHRRQH